MSAPSRTHRTFRMSDRKYGFTPQFVIRCAEGHASKSASERNASASRIRIASGSLSSLFYIGICPLAANVAVKFNESCRRYRRPAGWILLPLIVSASGNSHVKWNILQFCFCPERSSPITPNAKSIRSSACQSIRDEIRLIVVYKSCRRVKNPCRDWREKMNFIIYSINAANT